MTKCKNTKRALVTSVLSMMLCVAMLIGSTFAWFTDNAQTGVNSIEAGTLRVDLVDSADKSLEGKALVFEKAGENELWEPGSTWKLQDVYVKNKGNLALKYRITITGIKGDAELNNVIDWTIQLGGTSVGLVNGVSPEFTLAAKQKSEVLSIVGVMDKEAGNEYQGKKIEGISIKVEAAQAAAEHDSNNNTYDAGAQYGEDVVPEKDLYEDAQGVIHVNSADGLKELRDIVNGTTAEDKKLYAGKTITLDRDIDLAGEEWTPINGWDGVLNGTTIDGNGHAIKNMKITGGDSVGFISNNASKLTIKNLTFNNAYVKTTDGNQKYAGVVIGKNYSAVTFEDVKIKNSEVRCTWQSGGFVGFAETNGPKFVNCSIADSFVGGNNCTSGAFFGLGAVDVTIQGGSAERVQLYTDTNPTTDAAKLAGYLYGKTLTHSNVTVKDVTVVSAYPN